MIEFVFALSLGVVLTLVAVVYMTGRNRKQFLKNLEQASEEYLRGFKYVKLEQIEGMFYLYNLENGEFITQGKNRTDLTENIVRMKRDGKIPSNSIFVLTPEQEEMLDAVEIGRVG